MLKLYDPISPTSIGKRLTREAFQQIARPTHKTTPRPYAVYEKDNGYLVTTPSAGVEKVHVEKKGSSSVIISFTAKDAEDEDNLLYRNRGGMETNPISVRLPKPVQGDIDVTEKGGELQIAARKTKESVNTTTTYTVM